MVLLGTTAASLLSPNTAISVAVMLAGFTYAIVLVGEKVGWIRSPSAWREQAEALEKVEAELKKQIADLTARCDRLDAENAELRRLPNYEAVYAMMQQVSNEVAEHNRREAETHARTLAALEAISDGFVKISSRFEGGS